MKLKAIHLQFEQSSLQSPDWLIWLLAMICVWGGLGAYGVLNNNEGLYAQISYDMLNSGDVRHWIIPYLNGLPYMEKPPLLYWLTAFAMFVFGEADWVPRLVPTLAGLATVGVILNFGRRIYRPQVGRMAALMFISGLGVLVICRTLLFDMLLTAFLTLTLLNAYLFKVEGHLRDLRIAHVGLAFAVLTKGFVALLLFGLVTLAWIILINGTAAWKQIGKWIDPVSIGLFLAITAPWFIAASLIEPIFPWFFFVNEHVLRFLGLRTPHDFYSGPWWYYLPRMVFYLFPWSLLVPIALLSRWTSLSRVEHQEFIILRKTLVLGWLVPLLFFSISNAKANYYVIVVMPFAALNLALLLEQTNFLTGKRSLILGGLIALCSCVLAVSLQFFSVQLPPHLSDFALTILGMPLEKFVVMLLWSVTVLSLFTAWLAWYFPRLGMVAYTAIPLFFMAAMLVATQASEPSISDHVLAKFIRHSLPGSKVYLYRNFERDSSLAFYLRKPITIINSTSADLYWGDKLSPDNPIMVDRSEFFSQKGPKVVVVSNIYLDEFTRKKLPGKFMHSKQFGDTTVFY